MIVWQFAEQYGYAVQERLTTSTKVFLKYVTSGFGDGNIAQR